MPGYYAFDRYSGRLTVTNDGTRLFSDVLRIVISSTDGVVNRQQTNFVYPYEQVSGAFTVATRCGEGSTVVAAPVFHTDGTLSQHSAAEENRLSLNSQFTSSNPRCPILTTSLADGEAHFDLTPLVEQE